MKERWDGVGGRSEMALQQPLLVSSFFQLIDWCHGQRLRGGSCTTEGKKKVSDVRVQPTSGEENKHLAKPIRLWRCVYVCMFAVVYSLHNMKLVCVYASVTFCCCQIGIFVPYCSLTSSLGNMSLWRTIKTVCQKSVKRQLNAGSITLIDFNTNFKPFLFYWTFSVNLSQKYQCVYRCCRNLVTTQLKPLCLELKKSVLGAP